MRGGVNEMIDRKRAIEIAKRHCWRKFKFELFSARQGLPDYVHILQWGDKPWTKENVWCVLCNDWPGHEGMLASSRAIVIDKETGKVLYDGSAGDEG